MKYYHDRFCEEEDGYDRKYEKVLNLDDRKIYLYKVTEEYKYLVAILPNKNG